MGASLILLHRFSYMVKKRELEGGELKVSKADDGGDSRKAA
jgi:hypothetical protein